MFRHEGVAVQIPKTVVLTTSVFEQFMEENELYEIAMSDRPDEEILQSQFPEVLEDQEQAQTRLAELQALFAAADEEDFEDSEETGVLPGDDVKSRKQELKEKTVAWKNLLKETKHLATDLFTELKAADRLPQGAKKGHYCS
jgi:type I restriction enzyme M protein